jgi:2-polyprenyl-3-methyl-5-hydroxy-6-metoxy-1,4-benzoquinol methylase
MRKLDYANTYYHTEPRLDVLAPPAHDRERFHFIISSDVLEHVAPPVEAAFANLRAMLLPGGTLVLTGTTLELRLFSGAALRRHLLDAAFSSVHVHREPVFERGIYWKHPWSVPITAIA